MARQAELSTGTLSSWNDERGFGFIVSGDETRRVFVHISAFASRSRRPVAGDTLAFRTELAPDGKTRAVGVRYSGDSASRRTRSAAPPRWGGYVVILAFVALFVTMSAVWDTPIWVAALYLVASIVCFLAYATDKSAARNGSWRVSESTLLLLGLVGGWPGAIVAQQMLRHKTIKPSFRAGFWLSVVVNIGVLVFLCSPDGSSWLLELVR